MEQLPAYEVTHALDLIRRHGRIPPGEMRLLAYLIDETLAGRGPAVSQKTVAADVFAKDLHFFDPRSDSIVRTTAANLRDRIISYYGSVGRTDPVVIELPKGSYVPTFTRRHALSPAGTSRLWSARVAMESRTVSGYRSALGHLDAVLSESPGLALGLALKAEALACQAIHGSRPQPNLEQAQALSEQALEADNPPWQAHLARAMVFSALDRNWANAGMHYQHAIDLSGGEGQIHPWYTAYLAGQGKPQESVTYLQRAVCDFSAVNPAYLGDLGMMQLMARDPKGARVTITGALEAAPEYYQNHLNLAVLIELEGDPSGAVEVLDAMPLKILERPVTWGLRAIFSGLAGNVKAARRRATWINAIQKTGCYVPSSQMAACWMGVGRKDKCVDSLTLAVEERDPLAVCFYAYPFFRHLHGYPPYEHLIDGIGLKRY